MRKAILILVGMLVCGVTSSALASKIDVSDQYDFKLALDYVAQVYNTGNRVDTLLLTTSGGNYTTTDTVYLQIKVPIVIKAAPGLAEKPVFTHSDPDSGVLEIFRIHNDVVFDGVLFDGYNARRPMKYALRVGHGPDNQIPRVYAKEGLNVTIKNCEFRNIYPPDWENRSGGSAFYFLRPSSGEPIIKAGTIIIENCDFHDIGDEAIRIAETEKYKVTRVADTLIVRNCTFRNIAAECIRFYADTDTSTEDAYVLIEHLTVDHSSVRTIYVKNNQNTICRDIIISNTVMPKPYRMDRSNYAIQVQQRGSYIAHIDTFNVKYKMDYENRIGATKGGYKIDETFYSFDPMYADAAGFDYTLLTDSPAYGAAHDGTALGDMRWATNSSSRISFRYSIEGGGTLLFDPPFIAPNYPSGTTVTVTAVPDSGWTFTGWSGDASGTDNPIQITVDAAKNITATFQKGTSVKEAGLQPLSYRLEQNYPNPFNPSTTIAFSIKKAGHVKIELFNVLGQRVKTVVNQHYAAGTHKVELNVPDLTSGMYFYRMTAGDFVAMKKFVLMR